MFVLQKTYDRLLQDSKRVFLEQMSETYDIERELNNTYRFAQECCDEIFKYTGTHEFHDRLDNIIRSQKEV